MSENNQVRKRVIQFIFLLTFVIIIVRLFSLQVITGKYKKLAADNAIFRKVVYPSRGIIFDRKGKAILNNSAIFDLMVTPYQVKNIDTAEICRVLEIDKEAFHKKMITSIIRNGKYRPSVFEGLLSPEMYGRLNEHLWKFPGFDLVERPVRIYPYDAGAHIMGYVGEVDSNIIRRSNYFYQMGDYTGLSGLERTYEKVLMGQRGIQFLVKDNKNRIQGPYENGEFDTSAIAGKNVRTYLDVELQVLAEKLLTNKIGSVVAIEPSTGGILAMASGPGFDPNLLTGSERQRNFARLLTDTARPLLNRAIKGQYPPGSTFKPLGALVALDMGVITPDYGQSCGGAYLGCRRPIKCSHAGGGHANNLRLSLANSCNSYYSHIFRMSIDNHKWSGVTNGLMKWKEYLNSFGMGVKLNIDLPSEDKGFVPDTSYYNKPRIFGRGGWNSCSIVSMGIGQGEMLATPLQLANTMAIIANKGFYYTPHFVKSIDDGGIEDTLLQRFRIRHEVTHMPDTMYKIVQLGMQDVVTKGTARVAQIPGISIAGKTGTAQNPHGKDNSLFVCFAPVENPKIAIAVVVENAGFGSTWAAPIASLMIEKYLNDTLTEARKAKAKQIEEADLIPPKIRRWYQVKDSIRRVRQMQKELEDRKKAMAQPLQTFSRPVEKKNKDDDKRPSDMAGIKSSEIGLSDNRLKSKPVIST